jgi:hypothetical protein
MPATGSLTHLKAVQRTACEWQGKSLRDHELEPRRASDRGGAGRGRQPAEQVLRDAQADPVSLAKRPTSRLGWTQHVARREPRRIGAAPVLVHDGAAAARVEVEVTGTDQRRLGHKVAG